MTSEPFRSHIQHVAEQYGEPIGRFIEAAEAYCAVIEAWDADSASFADREAFIVAVQRALPLVYARALDLPTEDELSEDIEDDDGDQANEGLVDSGASIAEGSNSTSGDSPTERVDAYNQERVDKFPVLANYAFGQLELERRLARYLRWDVAYLEVYQPHEHRTWDEDAEDSLDDSRFPRAAYEAIPQELLAKAASPGNLADDIVAVYDWLKESLLVWSSGGDAAMFDALWRWRFEFEIHAGGHLVAGLKAIHRLGYHTDPDFRLH